jgi:large subunit ribosomal protein L31
MKKEIHPTYQKVLFVDSASGHRFVCGTTLQPDAKESFEGAEYPVSYLSISSSSHPFFTGSKQLVDSEGRVEKFKKRFGRKPEVAKDESASQEDKEQEQSAKGHKPAVEKKAAKPVAAKKRA